MDDKRPFDEFLLDAPIAERKNYFKGKTIAHPKLTNTYQSLVRTIEHDDSRSIIPVYGPSGVGKTTLRTRLEQYLIDTYEKDWDKSPGDICYGSLELVTPPGKLFEWRDFFSRALVVMNEPLPDKKRCLQPEEDDYLQKLKSRIRKNPTPTELQEAFERCLIRRRTKVFIVDEAQILKYVGGGRTLEQQMNVIKSLCNVTKVKVVLLGPYDLIDLLDTSGQAARRSTNLHFSRYRYDVADEYRAFRTVIASFQRYLPLREEPNLLGLSDYLYEHSLGCVGILKDWLNLALSVTLEEGKESLSFNSIVAAAPSKRSVETMVTEMIEGEKRLSEDTTYDIKSALGMNQAAQTPVNKTNSNTKKSARKQRPGKRNPNRDLVGQQPIPV